jgi:hypothetical protein
MDSGFQSPLIDLFRRGQAPRDAAMLAARGLLAKRAHEQIALLVLLADSPDAEIAAQAHATIDRLPAPALGEFLARPDVPADIRDFFARRQAGRSESAGSSAEAAPAAAGAADDDDDLPTIPEGTDEEVATILANLPVKDRMKLAMKGTREQRAQLVRDSNRMVATAVLSSPKLTEAEIEQFCKMGNVSEDVLRIIATNRGWVKNYGVVLGLVRNAKTPPALSMQMLNRLTEKDVKMLSVDRNVPEALRLAARRAMVKSKHG